MRSIEEEMFEKERKALSSKWFPLTVNLSALPKENMTGESDIAGFYRNRSIFITGATGFMGKVLVEKLLRCCPGIKNVYILMRPKRGNDVRTRLEELINTTIFDNLRKAHPEVFTKLIPISGDMLLPGLGISKSDVRILAENVSVVFHSAATVRFDEPLQQAVEMNLKGTKKLIDLCKQMSKIDALVHVSTAYCNCDKSEVHESFYAPPCDPNKLMEMIDFLDEDVILAITKRMVGKRPNTYTYTKALAEHLLMHESGQLPVAIVRPTIVTAAEKEPLPGWIDNINGPTGLIVGCGKGLIRSVYCQRQMIADIIPVDYPINLMLSVAWYTATHRPNNTIIYNSTSGSLNPLKWGVLESILKNEMLKYPMKGVVWPPGGSFKSSMLRHKIDVALFHYGPAYVVDTFAKIFGGKPRFVRIHDRATKAMACLQHFTVNQWTFHSVNTVSLLDKMSAEDKKIFYFDTRNIIWDNYLKTYYQGTKKYLLKEEVDCKESKHHLNRLYAMQYTGQVAAALLIWRLLATKSTVAHNAWESSVSAVMRYIGQLIFKAR
ncbi:putative fatty acyl-CoA reductase CG5065 isoform X2 [Artemia franciscana]